MGALRVALIGLRGSGKSTVGPPLARLLGAEFHDLDLELGAGGAGLGGRSAGELLAELGEPRFRALELAALEGLARLPGSQVLATGGGVVETPAARELLARSYACVWLRAPLELLAARLAADPTPRPRLAGADAREELTLLESRRAPWYRGLARVVVEVEDHAPAVLAQRILNEL